MAISSIPLWTSILLPLVQTSSFPFMPSTPSIPLLHCITFHSPSTSIPPFPLLPPLHSPYSLPSIPPTPSPPFPLLPPLHSPYSLPSIPPTPSPPFPLLPPLHSPYSLPSIPPTPSPPFPLLPPLHSPYSLPSIPPTPSPPLLRSNSARITDRRVKIMNEVISGMRVIKMYAWEHAFKGVVDRLRRYVYTCTWVHMCICSVCAFVYMCMYKYTMYV